ncbi:MAG: DUF4296 domain-containing protein [bacterium]|nr:DUF4296 domain-containing protein [bacterium]
MKPTTLLLLLSLFLSGCNNQPKAVLTETQFANLLADTLRLHKRYPEHPDSLVQARTALFQKYGIDETQLEPLIETYQNLPEAWPRILKQVEQNLKTDEDFPGSKTPPDSGRYRTK